MLELLIASNAKVDTLWPVIISTVIPLISFQIVLLPRPDRPISALNAPRDSSCFSRMFSWEELPQKLSAFPIQSRTARHTTKSLSPFQDLQLPSTEQAIPIIRLSAPFVTLATSEMHLVSALLVQPHTVLPILLWPISPTNQFALLVWRDMSYLT